MPRDLTQPISLGRRFDLAICLEVAEHIDEKRASDFLSTLTSFSDHVLFSAAIPYQGGTGHVNEQWPGYWARLFADKGYGCQDFIRKKIWNDSGIHYWYRQNILLFSKGAEHEEPLPMVHPELFTQRACPKGVKEDAKALWHSLLKFVTK